MIHSLLNFFAPDPTHGLRYYLGLLTGLIIGLGFLAALQAIPPRDRKATIAFFTFLGGAFYALEFFLPTHHLASGKVGNFLTDKLPVLGTLSSIFQATAAGLGVISLLGLHFRNLSRLREGWGYSVVLITSFFTMFLWGLLNTYAPGFVLFHKGLFLNAQITNEDVYNTLFYGAFNNLDASMFALIGFFVISASYRAFRIRNVEASLLMISALIVMLGQVTLGTQITHSLPREGFWSNFRLENLAQYILSQINSAAMRGIYFGIGVGFLATSLRLWLSLERGVYFDSEL